MTDADDRWASKITFIYTGEIYDEDGVMSFRAHIDDYVLLMIDGQTVLDHTDWQTPVVGSIDKGAGGWFDFELRMWNGEGNAGMRSNPGFGWDADGGSNYVYPENTEGTELFRFAGPAVCLLIGLQTEELNRGKKKILNPKSNYLQKIAC